MRSERAPKCLLHFPDLACAGIEVAPPIIEIGGNIKSPWRSLPTQCPTSRDFVPWRFFDVGQLSLPSVSSLPASKNQHGSGLSRLTSAIAADKFSTGIVAGTSPRMNCRHTSFCSQADWGH
jgi:hypothetical protein